MPQSLELKLYQLKGLKFRDLRPIPEPFSFAVPNRVSQNLYISVRLDRFLKGKNIVLQNAYLERFLGKRVISCTTAHFIPTCKTQPERRASTAYHLGERRQSSALCGGAIVAVGVGLLWTI